MPASFPRVKPARSSIDLVQLWGWYSGDLLYVKSATGGQPGLWRLAMSCDLVWLQRMKQKVKDYFQIT